MVPCKSTAEEVLFEWSHHRISPTDSKVRATLHVFITLRVTGLIVWEAYSINIPKNYRIFLGKRMLKQYQEKFPKKSGIFPEKIPRINFKSIFSPMSAYFTWFVVTVYGCCGRLRFSNFICTLESHRNAYHVT